MKKNDLMAYLTKPLIPTIVQTLGFLGILFGLGILLSSLSATPIAQLFSTINIELVGPAIIGLVLSLYILNIAEQFSLVKNFTSGKEKDLISVGAYSVFKALIFLGILFVVPILISYLGVQDMVQVISISTASLVLLGSTLMSLALTFFVWEHAKQFSPIKKYVVIKG